MSQKYAQQVELERGTERQLAWIESKYAEVGKPLKLKVNGQWDDGWVVKQSYPQSRMPYEWIRDRGRDFIDWRDVTDI